MGIGGYTQFLSDIVERNGCFHHPNAREYLMAPVIAELEGRIKHTLSVDEIFCYKEAIALIRGKP